MTNGRDQVDELHPTGPCTCRGEGVCPWCREPCPVCGLERALGHDEKQHTFTILAELKAKFARAFARRRITPDTTVEDLQKIIVDAFDDVTNELANECEIAIERATTGVRVDVRVPSPLADIIAKVSSKP